MSRSSNTRAILHVNDVLKKMHVNVRVKGLRGFALRARIGLWLVSLGGAIIGLPTHVSIERS